MDHNGDTSAVYDDDDDDDDADSEIAGECQSCGADVTYTQFHKMPFDGGEPVYLLCADCSNFNEHPGPFPDLPSDRPEGLIGKSLWETCQKEQIARWAFYVIREWAEHDHITLTKFYSDFCMLQTLHRSLSELFCKPYKSTGLRVNVEVNTKQGVSAYQHLLLLSTCGRGWHHFVGDLLFYTMGGGEDRPVIEPLSLRLLKP